MTVRTITYVSCPCGDQGSIVESTHDDSRSHWYLATMRGCPTRVNTMGSMASSPRRHLRALCAAFR